MTRVDRRRRSAVHHDADTLSFDADAMPERGAERRSLPQSRRAAARRGAVPIWRGAARRVDDRRV